MNELLTSKLSVISESLRFILPESVLVLGIIFVTVMGLVVKGPWRLILFTITTIVLLNFCILLELTEGHQGIHVRLFGGAIQFDDFSSFLKVIFDLAGCFTILMSYRGAKLLGTLRNAEYYVLLLSAILGAHFLVMSMNLLMVFLSLELLSISSYILSGIAGSARASEGSLKYFLYGAVASAIMLYGFSILYGLSGTLDFSSTGFLEHLIQHQTPLLLIAGIFSLAGYLFKITAVPMHLWAPDVYEAAPMPVVAFLSVVPKVAGVGALSKFILGINLFGQSIYSWQIILAIVVMATITVGNFSALWQKYPKRLMAYSSIAQAGFLLVGVVCFSIQGIQFLLFYAFVYLGMNYLVFLYLQLFEHAGIVRIEDFSGLGKNYPASSILLLVGLVSLAGIPPTSGFMAKLFIFSGAWQAFTESGKSIILWVLVLGLLNTAISMFFYLKIPYYAFFRKPIAADGPKVGKATTPENFMTLILVLVVVSLFFLPGLLMGWLNSITLVL